MKRPTLFLVIAAATVLAAAVPDSAYAGGYTHTRDGWVYGLNAGWGWARAEANDTGTDTSIRTDWFDDITGGLRVAFAPDDTYTYGLDFSGWTDAAQGLDETIFWIMTDFRYFPGGQGLNVHGGLGLGVLSVAYTSPGAVVSQSGGGFAWGVGAGWETRISPTFALGVSYDYRRVAVGQISILDDVSTAIHGATLAATWYMD